MKFSKEGESYALERGYIPYLLDLYNYVDELDWVIEHLRSNKDYEYSDRLRKLKTELEKLPELCNYWYKGSGWEDNGYVKHGS